MVMYFLEVESAANTSAQKLSRLQVSRVRGWQQLMLLVNRGNAEMKAKVQAGQYTARIRHP